MAARDENAIAAALREAAALPETVRLPRALSGAAEEMLAEFAREREQARYSRGIVNTRTPAASCCTLNLVSVGRRSGRQRRAPSQSNNAKLSARRPHASRRRRPSAPPPPPPPPRRNNTRRRNNSSARRTLISSTASPPPRYVAD